MTDNHRLRAEELAALEHPDDMEADRDKFIAGYSAHCEEAKVLVEALESIAKDVINHHWVAEEALQAYGEGK